MNSALLWHFPQKDWTWRVLGVPTKPFRGSIDRSWSSSLGSPPWQLAHDKPLRPCASPSTCAMGVASSSPTSAWHLTHEFDAPGGFVCAQRLTSKPNEIPTPARNNASGLTYLPIVVSSWPPTPDNRPTS